jgi:hypothetical protein
METPARGPAIRQRCTPFNGSRADGCSVIAFGALDDPRVIGASWR